MDTQHLGCHYKRRTSSLNIFSYARVSVPTEECFGNQACVPGMLPRQPSKVVPYQDLHCHLYNDGELRSYFADTGRPFFIQIYLQVPSLHAEWSGVVTLSKVTKVISQEARLELSY